MEPAVKTAKSDLGSIPTKYVARQPILALDESIFGYELLFRDGVQDFFNNPDADLASRSSLDTSLLIGLDVLVDGQRAFINCTRDLLLKDYLTLLPAHQTVIEILETVVPDQLVFEACQRMKKMGYTIAIDDFVCEDKRESLLPYADIVKVDLYACGIEKSAALAGHFQNGHIQMLAEKVETREQFLACRKAGFTLFQGYFFQRPELMHAREIPANRANYLRLLSLTSQEDWDPREIENIIKAEVSLCYRLLKYLNSPLFGLSVEIHNVRHALAMLGERELRHWIRLVATLVVGENRTSDLILSALVRARFCELFAPKLQCCDSDLFIVGLLSLMDAIMDMPLGVVLEGIPLEDDMRVALLRGEGPIAAVLKLAIALERGDWVGIVDFAAKMHTPQSTIAECHWNAMQWARQVTSAL